MSIQPQYETYRYTGEVARLQSQSIVECRLPGSEVGGILSVQAKAVPTECVCADGEVRYNGRILLCVVYEDADKKVCRMERGAEFFHKAEGAEVTPACFAKTAFIVENVSHRREGSGLYLSVVVRADVCVYGAKQMEYLVGGENVCADTQTLVIAKTVCVSGEVEAEDEFESDYVGDILMHGANAMATSVRAAAGEIDIEGELVVHVCVLQADGGVRSYERVSPFKMQIQSEEAFDNARAWARVCVKNAQISASVDEEKGKSKLVYSYVLSADCFVDSKEEISAAFDAFSPIGELCLKKQNNGGRYLMNVIKCTERIGGEAMLSPQIQGEYFLQAAVQPTVEIACKKGENGVEAEGVLSADVMTVGADGSHKSCTMRLPFAFPLHVEEDVEVEADALVCGLNVRRKKDGQTEAEATLKVCVRTFERVQWSYVSQAEAGEVMEETDAAISIFLPCEGENLWQVAKRLRRAPEELVKSNPSLEFPVKAGERIFVYRQIK